MKRITSIVIIATGLAVMTFSAQAQTTRAEKKAQQIDAYNKALDALENHSFFLQAEFMNAHYQAVDFDATSTFIVAEDGKATWQTQSNKYSFGMLPINEYSLQTKKNGDIACKITLQTNDRNKDGITINILLKNNTNTAIADLYVAKWSRNIQNIGNRGRTSFPQRITGKIVPINQAGNFQKYIWQSLDY